MVYQLTGSKLLLGVIAAAGTAPMLVFSFWGGSIADRLPKRSILVVTQTCAMLIAFAEAFLVGTGLVRPWQIVILALLSGIVLAFDMPARQAFAIEMTSREDLMNAISLNSTIVNGARLIGPSVAGLVMARIGIAPCFLLNGLSFLAVIAGLLMMDPPVITPVPHAGSTLRHALGGLHYVRHNRRVLTILSLFSVVGVFGWSYAVLMPSYAQDVLHLGAAGYGTLMASTGLGAFTTAVLGASMPRRPAVLGGVWLFSVMLFLLSLSHVFALSMLCLAVAAFGLMVFFSTSNTLVQTSVPDEMRGRVMGVWALIFGGAIPIGSLEAGTLAHLAGTPVAMGVSAFFCAAAAFVTWLTIRGRPSSSS